MSKYSTELRFICETAVGLSESLGYNNVNDIIQQAIPNIFNFDFPIFDEGYRNVLCTKILRHFYTREISEETVGLWRLRLETKMVEIMPYYNNLYKAWTVDFNPLYDTDVSTKHTLKRNENKNNESNSKGDTTDYSLYSDTPQGGLSGVENETYLTSAQKDTHKVTNNATSQEQAKSTDEYLEKITGKRGAQSYSQMLQDYKDALINIDMLIINELEPLFFQLW